MRRPATVWRWDYRGTASDVIWSSPARKKRVAALVIDSWSLLTLNAITALTARVIPCWVTQGSRTSASCIDNVRKDTLERRGRTKAPWPFTILNGAALSPRPLEPLISIASSGEGIRQPNIENSPLTIDGLLAGDCTF